MMATVERALYSKYSASQNYYYTKDVNEILSGTRGKALVQFKDFHQQDASEEYLKRVYRLAEYQGKIKMLSEYYKVRHIAHLPDSSTRTSRDCTCCPSP